MSCRTTDDCSWLDRDLLCQDYEVGEYSYEIIRGYSYEYNSLLQTIRTIIGGEFDRRGKCQCGFGKEWDTEDEWMEDGASSTLSLHTVMMCRWQTGMIVLFCLIGVVGLAIIVYTVRKINSYRFNQN